MKLNVGKKYGLHFFIEDDYLLVKKRTWFSVKEILRIECSTITKLESMDPYREFEWYKKILFVVLQIISSASSPSGTWIGIWGKLLCISYVVDGELAKSYFDTTLNRTEFIRLKKAIQKVLIKFDSISEK